MLRNAPTAVSNAKESVLTAGKPSSTLTTAELLKFRHNEIVFAGKATELIRPVTAFKRMTEQRSEAELKLLEKLNAYFDECETINPTIQTASTTIGKLVQDGEALNSEIMAIINPQSLAPLLAMALPTEAELLKLYNDIVLKGAKNENDVQAETWNTKNTYLAAIKTAHDVKTSLRTENQSNNEVLNGIKETQPDLQINLANLRQIASKQLKPVNPAPAVLTR